MTKRESHQSTPVIRLVMNHSSLTCGAQALSVRLAPSIPQPSWVEAKGVRQALGHLPARDLVPPWYDVRSTIPPPSTGSAPERRRTRYRFEREPDTWRAGPRLPSRAKCSRRFWPADRRTTAAASACTGMRRRWSCAQEQPTGGVRPNARENGQISPFVAVRRTSDDGSRPRRQLVLPKLGKSAKICASSEVTLGIREPAEFLGCKCPD